MAAILSRLQCVNWGPHIYKTRMWPSVFLQMGYHMVVPDHQLAQCRLQIAQISSKLSGAYMLNVSSVRCHFTIQRPKNSNGGFRGGAPGARPMNFFIQYCIRELKMYSIVIEIAFVAFRNWNMYTRIIEYFKYIYNLRAFQHCYPHPHLAHIWMENFTWCLTDNLIIDLHEQQ